VPARDNVVVINNGRADVVASAEHASPNPAYAWFVVIVLTLAYTCSFVDRQILTLLIEPIPPRPAHQRYPGEPARRPRLLDLLHDAGHSDRAPRDQTHRRNLMAADSRSGAS
jgi:hypothetical protein